MEGSASIFSCSTLRYVVDARRELDVPVGVILWNEVSREWWFRTPVASERVNGVPPGQAAPYLEAVRAQLEQWRDQPQPYAAAVHEPLSSAWWNQARRLMQFRVRLGHAQPVDCVNPEVEIESLFEALVQPRTGARRRAARIDGAVTRALGSPLAGRFARGKTARGYGDREVPVLRLASDQEHLVVVEAVNLALETAERDTDALVSRLLRIVEGSSGLQIRFLVGYLASPGGFNGEAVLKDWIEHRVQTRVYDLVREAEHLQVAAREAIRDFHSPLGLEWPRPAA